MLCSRTLKDASGMVLSEASGELRTTPATARNGLIESRGASSPSDGTGSALVTLHYLVARNPHGQWFQTSLQTVLEGAHCSHTQLMPGPFPS